MPGVRNPAKDDLEGWKLRIKSLVKTSDSGCWEWQGFVARNGYGRIGCGGRGKHVAAHRMSYTAFVGPIPDGMFICHKCDNPVCVNPDHLFIGTVADNNEDFRLKSMVCPHCLRQIRRPRVRAPRKSRTPLTKIAALTPQQREEIIARRQAGEIQETVAAGMGVDPRTVREVERESGLRFQRAKPVDGVTLKGENCPGAKLNNEKIRQIREMGQAMTVREIAKQFGIAYSGVSRILRGEIWSHVK